MPTLGLGTTCHVPLHVNVAAEPFVGAPIAVIVLVPFGGGENGAGSVGVVVEPVVANSGFMVCALQLFSRQPRPNVACRLASSE